MARLGRKGLQDGVVFVKGFIDPMEIVRARSQKSGKARQKGVTRWGLFDKGFIDLMEIGRERLKNKSCFKNKIKVVLKERCHLIRVVFDQGFQCIFRLFFVFCCCI